MLVSSQALPETVTSQAHRLVRDLHNPNPRFYWADMLATAAVAWSGFIGVNRFRAWSWEMFVAYILCVLATYRGLCFLHEVTHVRAGALRKFELAWNILFGVPLLLPSFMYVGVHQYHHNLATYGTDKDPEYLPFCGKPLMILIFLLQSLLIPFFLLARFFLLAPAGFIIPRLHRWICAYASALCLNVKFRRETPDPVRSFIRRWEIITLISWATAGVLIWLTHTGWRPLIVWYFVLACVAVINTARTLGAHRYASDGSPLDRDEQLIDSIDTPGAFWTELWAPVGLRFHALHHYFPGIPYHNLGEAYSRLITNLPQDAQYRRTGSPSLPYSINTLCRGKYQIRG